MLLIKCRVGREEKKYLGELVQLIKTACKNKSKAGGSFKDTAVGNIDEKSGSSQVENPMLIAVEILGKRQRCLRIRVQDGQKSPRDLVWENSG